MEQQKINEIAKEIAIVCIDKKINFSYCDTTSMLSVFLGNSHNKTMYYSFCETELYYKNNDKMLSLNNLLKLVKEWMPKN